MSTNDNNKLLRDICNNCAHPYKQGCEERVPLIITHNAAIYICTLVRVRRALFYLMFVIVFIRCFNDKDLLSYNTTASCSKNAILL